MKINPISFTGYDARPLKGFFMSANCNGLAREMQEIGNNEGFDIYSTHLEDDGYHCKKELPNFQDSTDGNWAQDLWMIIKGKLLTAFQDDCESDSINELFNLEYDKTERSLYNYFYDPELDVDEYSENYHVPGGNIYIVKGDNSDEAIVGSDALENCTKSELEAMYSVDKVTILPQMDYHIDLFIRPLDNKRILLTDDGMSLDLFKQGLSKLMDFVKKNPEEGEKYQDIADRFVRVLANFETAISENKNADPKKVEKILKESGYEVIKVPGRVYRVVNGYCDSDESEITNYCNYMNANVLKNKNGELVYITNDSIVDDMLGITPEIAEKIGFSFQDSFVEALSPYVKRVHIYFVKGDNNFVKNEMLMCYFGGIHCSCAEIPEK